MRVYKTTYTPSPTVTAAARAAKARRQAVLRRVRAQRAAARKRTMADWMREGLLMKGGELKERYLGRGYST